MLLIRSFPQLSLYICGEDVVDSRHNHHYPPTDLHGFFKNLREIEHVNFHLYYTGIIESPIHGTSIEHISDFFMNMDTDHVYIDEKNAMCNVKEELFVLSVSNAWEETKLYILVHTMSETDGVLHINLASFDRIDFLYDFLSWYKNKVNSIFQSSISLLLLRRFENSDHDICAKHVSYLNNIS